MVSTFRIGTYNVENLFDRFDDPHEAGDDPDRRYGTSPKSRSKLFDLGSRIRMSQVDILGIQEVENFGALRDFVQASLGPKPKEFKVTKGIVTQQSNDRRGIDLGLLSSLQLGRVISHRFREFDRKGASKPYRFARDCLQVEVLDTDRQQVLVTVLVCHFKSKHSQYDQAEEPQKYKEDQMQSLYKRRAEAREVREIIKESFSLETDRFAVVGDFNDTVDSSAICPLVGPNDCLGLFNAATLISQKDSSPESDHCRPRDTHRWTRVDEATGKVKHTWSQIDHILLSPALYKLCTGKAEVLNTPADQGSDHYLFWVEFDAPKGLTL